ncbi:putative DNA binding domain-containing protein [Porphyromonadaceae bacterium OttesenSCG-928-L07]|nr:putative DNA binding domain-containing protein [Porphyromonadaceae bacterium OttesenSCG-928-L07]MDL2251871.1 putative DNA binding domain-containing protein [Odoribacter sp. OttesenSCG-928-J03]MDL2330560.1 putative DNA binding domain-containing protein [Odoribacter sp. OttesenSCG-928-A06]
MEHTLNKLLSLSTENEVVEFKEAKTQFDKDTLGRYFSALSNEANLRNQKQAWLVFGVKNDKSIVGTTISDKQINDYKAEMARHTSPRCSFTNVYSLQKQGKTLLLLEIPATLQGQPMSWKGHYYGRDGESIGALSGMEYDAIKSQTNKQDWSKEIIEAATIDDLSEEAIQFARIQYKEKNPKQKTEIDSWSDELFLNKAKITIKGKITNTAILLLGKPESEHFISPAVAKVTWILKDKDNVEKDYEHFYNPLITVVEQVSSKIRNLKYRYIKSDTLFPDEVEQYDPYIIREALHNCIAHQDYSLGGKIIVVENEDGYLTFTNSGSFIPKSVEEVVMSDSPEPQYRNAFLAGAMVNLNMIDTIGSGIKKMYTIQRRKFFPLPEYDLSNQKVKVTIIGKVVNINYARKIAQMPNLSLDNIILLDKVAKQKILSDEEAKELKAKRLIEGRKPNFHISSDVAVATEEKETYIKQRGFKDEHYKKMILSYIKTYGKASKKEIGDLILDILPSILNETKKNNKIKNIVSAMSTKDKTIKNKGTKRNPIWILNLPKNESNL